MTAFRVLRFGSDALPPVTCLHDVHGHAGRFQRLARMLESGRHVVAYDLRGHGRSPWSGPHTMEQHVSDLVDVLDACRVERTGLIGEGFGGRIAVAAAWRLPERITSITLLDPPFWPSPEAVAGAAFVPADGRFTSLDDAIEWRRIVDGLVHTPRALLEEEMAEHLVADGNDGGFHYRCNRAAVAAACELIQVPEENLHDVGSPTLLIRGAQSPLFTEHDLDRAETELRRVRVEVVPGGHVVLWDALAETSAHVRSFLVAAAPR